MLPFKLVYSDLRNAKKTRAAVEAALAAIDEYLLRRAATIAGTGPSILVRIWLHSTATVAGVPDTDLHPASSLTRS